MRLSVATSALIAWASPALHAAVPLPDVPGIQAAYEEAYIQLIAAA